MTRRRAHRRDYFNAALSFKDPETILFSRENAPQLHICNYILNKTNVDFCT